jgi:hypothetical protein
MTTKITLTYVHCSLNSNRINLSNCFLASYSSCFIYDIILPLIVSELLKDDFITFATEFSNLLSNNGITLREEKKNDDINRYIALNTLTTEILLLEREKAEHAFGEMININTVHKRTDRCFHCHKPLHNSLNPYCRQNCSESRNGS